MNIFLWILQFVLAIHTGVGSFWKFSHSAAQTMPSLAALSNGVWKGMSMIELICAAALILPALNKSLMKFASFAAIGIAAEMLVFCVLHLISGARDVGPMVYWLVVAALCIVLAYRRSAPKQ